MTKYLKTKEGSIEDVAKQMQNKVMENDYQDKFKKALDKEGKPLGHMTGAEKKAFFNKVDKMHKGKDENAMSVADVDRLKKQGNTVVVIEHNLDVIKTADWIIDLGPEGGSDGGSIVAEGTPEDVVKKKDSYTGQFLKEVLN